MKLSVFSILLIISSSLFSQSKKNNYGLDSAISRLDSSLTLLQQIVKYTKEQNDSLIFPEIDTAVYIAPPPVPAVNASLASPQAVTVPPPSNDYFMVEINSALQPLDKDHRIYKKFKNITETYENGMFRYTVGKFSTEKKAKKFIEYIREMGFFGSIAPVVEGKRVYK